MRHVLPLAAALTLLWTSTGCESGTYRDLTVTVPSAVAATFTAEAPGVLVVPEVGGAAFALCGQEVSDPLNFAFDTLYSCRPDKGERDVLVEAWIDEAPTGWTAAEICGASVTDRGLVYAGDRTDPVPTLELASTPAASWAYGSTQATWKGDSSPCGGTLRTQIDLQ